jgi:hypothetical protein
MFMLLGLFQTFLGGIVIQWGVPLSQRWLSGTPHWITIGGLPTNGHCSQLPGTSTWHLPLT